MLPCSCWTNFPLPILKSTASRGDVHFQYRALAPCGISLARNTALCLCRTDILLFTEPDARADPNWAFYLCETLSNGAAVVGGRILVRKPAPRKHQNKHLIFYGQFNPVSDIGQC